MKKLIAIMLVLIMALSLFQAGLSKVVPLYPSSTKHWVLVKPLSSANFCRMAFWDEICQGAFPQKNTLTEFF